MIPSNDAKDLIKCFESFRPKAYWCPGKVLTIGYGTTRGVVAGQEITHEEALKLLEEDLQYFAHNLRLLIKVPLNQHQFDALISFVYNIGIGAFKKSTLLKKLNAGLYEEVPKQMMRWVFVKGIVFKGLARRRKAEATLFSKPTT